MNQAIGGPGTALSWTIGGAAPTNLLSNAAFVYCTPQVVWGVEQIAIHVQANGNAIGPTGTMRLRWGIVDSSTPPLAVQDFDEVIEVAGALLAGPPAAQQFTLNIKEWGPIVTTASPGRKYTIIRPVVAQFVSIGILWSAAAIAGDGVNVWLERQSGGSLQGPST